MHLPHVNRISALVAFLGLISLHAIGADLSPTYDWKPMKIGGGGWATGLDVSPTTRGLMYVRTDVSGAYRWNAATASWRRWSSAWPR